MKKEKSGGSLNRSPKFVWFLIAAAIVFLVVVQVLFSRPAPADIFKAPWGAGDLLSFVGTMALGVIAVHQTWKANEVSRSRIGKFEKVNGKAEAAWEEER